MFLKVSVNDRLKLITKKSCPLPQIIQEKHTLVGKHKVQNYFLNKALQDTATTFDSRPLSCHFSSCNLYAN